MSEQTWILASNSPRRKELLGLFQQPFQVLPADVDERVRSAENPAAYVLRLAEHKSAVIAAGLPHGGLIIAADTTVTDGDDILGKPVDEADARAMLTRLRGRIHQVYTALSLRDIHGNFQKLLLCRTEVPMRNFSDAEVNAYIAGGDPMDKAGAYGIQNPWFHPVENFSGCYASVMGLPLCHLAFGLAGLGQMPDVSIAAACQMHLRYDCPIHERVLRGETAG